MNSLQQLNNYSLTQIEFNDFRPTDVFFDRPTALNQTLVLDLNETHTVPLGINIEEVVNPSVAQVKYIINLTSITGDSSISYTTLPSGVSVVESPQNVFTVNGIISKFVWDQISQPVVTLPTNTTGNVSYNVTIEYNTDSSTETKPWVVNLEIGN
jgi:hypothetical protein